MYSPFNIKYKPKNINEIIGQKNIKKIIKNSIKKKQINNTILFVGQRGIGKTSFAKTLTKSLNCELGIKIIPCNICKNCKKIEKNMTPDVIEINGANENGIDTVREIIKNSNFRPLNLRYKIFIIDEIQMFTPNAFNCLLKILEETPEFIKFFLITTETNKIPITILSRCQINALTKIKKKHLIFYIKKIIKKENIKITNKAAEKIVEESKGSVRECLILLEQIKIIKNNKLITKKDILSLLCTPKKFYINKLYFYIINKKKKETFSLIKFLYKKKNETKKIIKELIKKTKKNINSEKKIKKKEYILLKILIKAEIEFSNFLEDKIVLFFIVIKFFAKIN